jgi:hypothetical protein
LGRNRRRGVGIKFTQEILVFYSCIKLRLL